MGIKDVSCKTLKELIESNKLVVGYLYRLVEEADIAKPTPYDVTSGVRTGFSAIDTVITKSGCINGELSVLVGNSGSPVSIKEEAFTFPYLPSEYATIKAAIDFAIERHEGQLDKAGEPYIDHLFRVMLRCKTWEARVVAMLHDVVEDHKAELWEIAERFGLHFSYWVEKMDRSSADSPDEYYLVIKGDPILLEVKAADIADNMDEKRLNKLDPKTKLRLQKKYWNALLALGIAQEEEY
jgi:hypothetical protein